MIIERTAKQMRVTIQTSRPGVIIGRSGKDITLLEEELKKLTKKDVKILINEIKRPELDAQLVAENIAQQLEGRISSCKAMKQSVGAAIRMEQKVSVLCVQVVLVELDMSRTEQYKEGQVPLHTIRADIDYGTATAQTIYGAIGVKTWICRGEIIGKPVIKE